MLISNVQESFSKDAVPAISHQHSSSLEDVQQYVDDHAYIAKRADEYPPITDYLDGVVKGDQEQIDAYIAACQAVKTKYPKPE